MALHVHGYYGSPDMAKKTWPCHPNTNFYTFELNRLRRDRIAAILAANVYYAGETPAVQIQIPILSS